MVNLVLDNWIEILVVHEIHRKDLWNFPLKLMKLYEIVPSKVGIDGRTKWITSKGTYLQRYIESAIDNLDPRYQLALCAVSQSTATAQT